MMIEIIYYFIYLNVTWIDETIAVRYLSYITGEVIPFFKQSYWQLISLKYSL